MIEINISKVSRMLTVEYSKWENEDYNLKLLKVNNLS